MRIAILSMHKVINYGSVLQAYSLREMIKKVCGESAEFIDIKEEPYIEAVMPIQDGDDYNKECYVEHYICTKIKNFIMYKMAGNIYFKKVREFWASALGITADTTSNHYDLVFVGSDEVFKCTNKIITQLYGRVDNAEKVVTYAASCGSAVFEGIPEKSVDEVRACMENFQKMSVRDNGTREYVAHLYDGNIEHHLDPVLVGPLSSRPRDNVKLKKYMIVYAYNERIRTKEEILAIKSFAKAHGLKTVCMGGVLQWCDLYIPASPFRMLDYFAHADYIVTDTFHGTIFSVINHKKFVSIIRPTNKNKMSNLLADLGLEDRMLFDVNKLSDTISAEIDYRKVDAILAEERKKSEEYISNCIGLIGNDNK